MLKRIFLPIIMFSLILSKSLYAEEQYICPSVEDVKQLRDIWPNGSWMPLYIEGEELASEEDIAKFSKTVTGFSHAQWDTQFLEAGHCFYKGSDPVVEKITLARDMLKPKLDDPFWKMLGPKNFICFGPLVAECNFGGAGENS